MASAALATVRRTPPTARLNPKQIEVNNLLAGPQRHTMIVGGARSGKTFLLVRAIIMRALRAPGSRHVILRRRGNAVWRSIGLDTFPKVLRLCFPGIAVKWNKTDRYAKFANGAEVWLGGLDDKERVDKILGSEYATIYLNEASEIDYSSYLTVSTRLAQVCDGLVQRLYVDLNPGSGAHWTNSLFIKKVDPEKRDRPLTRPDDYAWSFIRPVDNAENLDPKTLKALSELPERQRRRFWDGEFTDDVDGALWTWELLDKCRCEKSDVPQLTRVVVAVDPSGCSGVDDKRSDSVGIVVAGLGFDGICYVLADRTCRLGPAGWGRVAVDAYNEFEADCVIAERNYGGAMVAHVIQTTDARAPYREVVASRGKVVRAEPVSALYEPKPGESAGRVRHVGRFADLEEQLSHFSMAGYLGEKSPDRADALVWAVTELMLSAAPPEVEIGTYSTRR